MPFSVLPHTADTGIEATADSLAGLIEALALGMFSLVARVGAGDDEEALSIEVTAETPEALVVATLSELLYLAEARDRHLYRFEVHEAVPGRISLTAYGVAPAGVEPTGAPIKAVTWHEVAVEERERGWYGRVYFDV